MSGLTKNSVDSLDPADWTETRQQAHRMLDDILDHVQDIRAQPVWQPMPEEARTSLIEPLPQSPQPLHEIHAEFLEKILPYGSGNIHPGFMGWVQGAGTVPGLLAEMLAAGMNANLGGRDHSGIELERQVGRWVRDLFLFPEAASGLFVTGTSQANLLAVLTASRAALGHAVRTFGLGSEGALLRGYTSKAAHGCVKRAFDFAGLGSDALTQITVDDNHRIDIEELRYRIRLDRQAGLSPFMVIASAGTVDTGAIDDLAAIAALCASERLWFHVDGAFGALGMLSQTLAPRLAGIEQADSIALDFHKWGQVPYDAGFLLVRDGQTQLNTFASPAAYLSRESRGLAANSPWPCDFGPDLSRGFRALKVWFTIKAFGTDQIGRVIDKCCDLAKHLEARVLAEPQLQLLSPAQLNIVCFRFKGGDHLNREIVADLHEAGLVAPSATLINGRTAIRACFINHRTDGRDVDALVDGVLRLGQARSGLRLREGAAAA